MWYEWNIFLAIEAHFQESIHPGWIYVLAGGFFFKHLFEWWVCWPQFLQGRRSKQWPFTWPTLSQCWHLTICCGGGRGVGEDELSWINPTLWIWWVWSSLECERRPTCHIQGQFCACCWQALPKVWWWAWEVQAKFLHMNANLLLKWALHLN